MLACIVAAAFQGMTMAMDSRRQIHLKCAAAARSVAPYHLPFLAMMFEIDALAACRRHKAAHR